MHGANAQETLRPGHDAITGRRHLYRRHVMPASLYRPSPHDANYQLPPVIAGSFSFIMYARLSATTPSHNADKPQHYACFSSRIINVKFLALFAEFIYSMLITTILASAHSLAHIADLSWLVRRLYFDAIFDSATSTPAFH